MKDRVHDVFGFGKCHDGDVVAIVGRRMGVASYTYGPPGASSGDYCYKYLSTGDLNRLVRIPLRQTPTATAGSSRTWEVPPHDRMQTENSP